MRSEGLSIGDGSDLLSTRIISSGVTPLATVARPLMLDASLVYAPPRLAVTSTVTVQLPGVAPTAAGIERVVGRVSVEPPAAAPGASPRIWALSANLSGWWPLVADLVRWWRTRTATLKRALQMRRLPMTARDLLVVAGCLLLEPSSLPAFWQVAKFWQRSSFGELHIRA